MTVTDKSEQARPGRVPRDPERDYTPEMATIRREFVREQTGAELAHMGRHSFDPSILPGNVENFIGVAQVPIGVAGPLLINVLVAPDLGIRVVPGRLGQQWCSCSERPHRAVHS